MPRFLMATVNLRRLSVSIGYQFHHEVCSPAKWLHIPRSAEVRTEAVQAVPEVVLPLSSRNEYKNIKNERRRQWLQPARRE